MPQGGVHTARFLNLDGNRFVLFAGDDVVAQQIQLLLDGFPADLTGATEVTLDVPLDPAGSGSYQAKLSTSQIAVVGDAKLGVISLTITAANTAGALVGSGFDVDVTVTNGGHKQTYRADQAMDVLQKDS